jgi:NADH-quinone oxidoreductase subunit N
VTKFPTPAIDWAALSPELVLLGGGAVCLLLPLFMPRAWRRHFCALVSIGCFIGAGAAAIVLFHRDVAASGVVVDAIERDRLAELAQVIVAGSGLLTVGVSYAYVLRERTSEYYALLLTAAAGMCFFVAASNLMTMFLGLEWFSISLYVLCAIAIEELVSLEAGLKYLIVGSFGSAILLFGSAFVYGATGAINFGDIASASGTADQLFLVTGLAMIIVGLGFKASAAPFHMWTPDVYQGAPTPVTAFMSAATKVAALVLTTRLLTTAFPAQEDLWTISLAVIVCISLAWGNLAALVQTDVKRMLAYSSISHAGFLLMPVAVGTELGGQALMYYLIAYAAMSIGSFAVVAARERELARPVTLEGMAGLGWERPGLGAAMTLFMFGFIGLPPAALFIGKFYVFSAAVDRGWTWLAIVGAVATAVSVYYYLGVVRAMYFQPAGIRVAPAGGSPPRDVALGTSVLLTVVVTIGSFIAAQPLLDIAQDAVAVLQFPH